MISKRLLQLALVALSASQVAQAHYGAAAINAVVARNEEGLMKRQSQSSGSSVPANTPRPSASTTNAPSPSPSATTATTNRPSSSATTRQSPSNNPTTQPTSTGPDAPETSSTRSEETGETKPSDPPKTTSTLPPRTSTIIETITNTDGSLTTKTSESVTTPTVPADTNNENKNNTNNNNAGMTPQTRNIIIGVVVGVGGAIILAVIALFAWRMWGRKKAADENDGLMDYGTPGYHPGPAEPKDPSVPGSSSVGTAHGRSPFQSTLESYHAPTQVNTASNF